MSNISVFGSTGFIGKKWMSLYEDISIAEPRESINPISKNILYLRSTNSNYNVLKDASIDIRSNLLLLTETLNNLKKNSNFLLTSSWFVYGKNNIHLKNSDDYYSKFTLLNALEKNTGKIVKFSKLPKYTSKNLQYILDNKLFIDSKLFPIYENM